jgi:hypothetical protein
MGDDDITQPIIPKGTKVEFESLDLEPGMRGEINIAPSGEMVRPKIFMSTNPKACVNVEEIWCGLKLIFSRELQNLEGFRFGMHTQEVFGPKNPLKVIVNNLDFKITRVAVSLVVEGD